MSTPSERERSALADCAALRLEIEALQHQLEVGAVRGEVQTVVRLESASSSDSRLTLLLAEGAQLTEELKQLPSALARDGLALNCERRTWSVPEQHSTLLASLSASETKIRENTEKQASARAIIREHTSATERTRRDTSLLKERLCTAERQAAERGMLLRQLHVENAERMAGDVRATVDASRTTMASAHKHSALRASALAKLANLQRQTQDAEQQREALTRSLESLVEGEMHQRRAAEAMKKHILEMKRQLDEATKAKANTQTASQRQADGLALVETGKRLLQGQAAGLHQQALSMTRAMQTVQHQLTACAAETSEANEQRTIALIEVQRSDAAALLLQADLSAVQQELQERDKRFETVSGDRNKQGQLAIDARRRVQSTVAAVDILHRQAERLKDGIAFTDEHMLATFLQHCIATRGHEQARAELKHALIRAAELQVAVKKQHAEIGRFQALIADGEVELKSQHAARGAVMSERGRLADRLSRCTHAMHASFDHLKSWRRHLYAAEQRTQRAQGNARELTVQLARTLSELGTIRRQFATRDALRHELLVLGRELLSERARLAAFADAQTVCIHRCRSASYECGDWLQTADAKLQLHSMIANRTRAIAARSEEICRQQAERRKLEHAATLREKGHASEPLLLAYQSDLRDKASELSVLTSQLTVLRSQYLGTSVLSP